MPDPRQVSAAVARRFLALHHLLAPPRSLPPEPASVLRVMERLGTLQFDPLTIAGRNHDLSLQARISGYQPGWTDQLLYRDRVLFEAFNKMLSILPVSEMPWYRISWDRNRRAHERETFAEHSEAVDSILERIRREGPLSALDFEHGGDIDWYWRPTNRTRALLEALWEAGTLGIERRVANRRYYDLAERIFPAALLAERREERDQLRHKLLSIHRAHGLAGASGNADLWLGVTERDESGRRSGAVRAPLRQELLDSGALIPVEVEGIRGLRFVLADEAPLLDQADREVAAAAPPGGAQPGVSFLAPLDPLVWDRDLLRRLYGFDYVWEVYVPAARRRWGYYVLPLLFGDRFVGRIEPRIERPANGRGKTKVRIVGLWWEQGFRPRQADGFVPAMRAALSAYRRFAGAGGIDWGPGLEAAGRLFGQGRRAPSGHTAAPRPRAVAVPARATA
jgi:uncharacterized protein YcaQ